MIVTKVKDVNGLAFMSGRMIKCPLTIRFSADDQGFQSLSISFGKMLMLQVPFTDKIRKELGL